MKQNKLFIIVIFLMMIIFSSCTFSKFKREENIYFNEPDESTYYNIIIEELHITKNVGAEKLKENALHIFELLLHQYSQEQNNQKNEDLEKNDNFNSTDLYAIVLIKEESFIKEFETINTSTLEIGLFNNKELNGEPEIISFLTVDTDSTITSYKFLYSLIERVLGSIFK